MGIPITQKVVTTNQRLPLHMLGDVETLLISENVFKIISQRNYEEGECD